MKIKLCITLFLSFLLLSCSENNVPIQAEAAILVVALRGKKAIRFPFEMKTDHNMVKDIIPLKQIVKFDYNSIQKKEKINTVSGSIKVTDSEKLQALLTTALLTGNTNFESLMPTIDASFATKEKHEPKSKVQKFTLSYIENKDSVTIQKIQLIN